MLAITRSLNPQDIKVSFIIVALDQLHSLNATLESIYAQTYVHFECIVLIKHELIFNEMMLEPWLKRSQIKFYPLFSTNIFHYFNRGSSLAKGHYLYFLKSGDLFIGVNTIETMVNLALEHSIPDLVYMGTLFEEEKLGTRAHFYDYSKANLKKNCACAPLSSCMILRSTFIGNGRFNTRFKQLADFDWLCRMYQKVGFRIVCKEIFAVQSGVACSKTIRSFYQLKEFYIILRKNFGFKSALYSLTARQTVSAWLKRLGCFKSLAFKKHSFSALLFPWKK